MPVGRSQRGRNPSTPTHHPSSRRPGSTTAKGLAAQPAQRPSALAGACSVRSLVALRASAPVGAKKPVARCCGASAVTTSDARSTIPLGDTRPRPRPHTHPRHGAQLGGSYTHSHLQPRPGLHHCPHHRPRRCSYGLWPSIYHAGTPSYALAEIIARSLELQSRRMRVLRQRAARHPSWRRGGLCSCAQGPS